MSTDNKLALSPEDLWDGLPTGTRFTDVKQALIMNRPGRKLLDIQWDMSPFKLFGGGGNLQSSLTFTVIAPRVAWPVYTKPKAVSQLVLADGTLYNVTASEGLLDEE